MSEKTGLIKTLLKAIGQAVESEDGEPEAGKPTAVQMGFKPATDEKVAKTFDEDKHLVTAIVLRPEVEDLHGDIYSADEVEKACYGFNVHCRQANIQHEKMEKSIQFVESYIAPADFQLGDGFVKKGDWVATAHVPDDTQWSSVKAGEFTGFSIGCVATVQELS